jgi:hypothetical protein
VTQFSKLVAIIPLSRIDPEAADVNERTAQATLASYQVLWHPLLLARATTLPVWCASTDPTLGGPDMLVLVPECSRRGLPPGWEERAAAAGACVVFGGETHDQLWDRIAQQLPGISLGAEPVPDTVAGAAPASQVAVADFYALGAAKLWWDTMLAQMGRSTPLAEEPFQAAVLAAAAAFASGNATQAGDSLGQAFTMLGEARNNVYPVELHILDLLLVDPTKDLDRLERQLSTGQPLNILLSGRAAEQLSEQAPAIAAQIRVGCDAGTIEIIGGEYEEQPTALWPIESQLWQFAHGRATYERLFGRSPTFFGRRRFGLCPWLPQMLSKHGVYQALHFAFDDGDYPEQTEVRFRWEGPDSTTIEALARLPFRVDVPQEWLAFPRDLAKTIGGDQMATIVMTHWPMPDSPWYDALLRVAGRGAALGKFVTLSQFMQSGYGSGVSVRHQADKYVSPFLLQGAVLREADAVSRYVHRHRLRAAADAAIALDTMARTLGDEPPRDMAAIEHACETGAADAESRAQLAIQAGAAAIARMLVPPGEPADAGFLAINPLSFVRQVAVEFPPKTDSNTAANVELSSVPAEPRVLEVPAFGYVWVSQTGGATAVWDEVHVTDLTMRNSHIYVELDAQTGGIRGLQRAPGGDQLLAEQLVLHGLPRRTSDRDAARPIGDELPESSLCKVRMVAESVRVDRCGPAVAEAVAEGTLVADPCPDWTENPVVARFRQRMRLQAGRPIVQVNLELLDLAADCFESSRDPYRTYFGVRFAYPRSNARLMRSAGTAVEWTQNTRFEAASFVEIHSRRTRTAIVTGGLPFYRRHKRRMVDLLLVTAAERCREFQFWIGLDLVNPWQTAQEMQSAPIVLPVAGRPRTGVEGWFFHLDACNVAVLSARPLPGAPRGLRLRLLETAGEPTHALLTTWCPVRRAVMSDFLGNHLITLDSNCEGARLDLVAHELAQVDIEFEDSTSAAGMYPPGDVG